MDKNVDEAVVAGFGDEWTRFDQSGLTGAELKEIARSYFAVFPWGRLDEWAVGFDLGCGSGRWAKFVAPRVGMLHCIDPSPAALDVARRNLAGMPNVSFHLASVDDIPVPDGSQDFGYCLGVLHHVPDTAAGLRQAAAKLKPGAPFLVYLYYAFDNRPAWFRVVWKGSDVLRRVISRAPHQLRYFASQVLAGLVYLPLARFAGALEALGVAVDNLPLSAYRRRSFYVMRNDALDRFGTRLERRFTRAEILDMMQRAGLTDVVFSEAVPYWCAVGYRT